MSEARFESKQVHYRVRTDVSVLSVLAMAKEDYPDFQVHAISRMDRGMAISGGFRMGIETEIVTPPGYTIYTADLMRDTTDGCKALVSAKLEQERVARERAKEKAAVEARLARVKAEEIKRAAEKALKEAEAAAKALEDFDAIEVPGEPEPQIEVNSGAPVWSPPEGFKRG